MLEFKFRYLANGQFAKFKFRLLYYRDLSMKAYIYMYMYIG